MPEPSLQGFAAVYVQEQQQTSSEEMSRIVERIEKFAAAQVLAVTEVFIEPLATRSRATAYRAMTHKIRARKARYVIAPGVHHFADLGKRPLSVVSDLKALDVCVIFAGHVE